MRMEFEFLLHVYSLVGFNWTMDVRVLHTQVQAAEPRTKTIKTWAPPTCVTFTSLYRFNFAEIARKPSVWLQKNQLYKDPSQR